MPLSRYTIRNEFSLANPDLYRVAEKDDPEGLLEGVATAGLVGIIRQLGDLAEFAAEVFHDLHEDVLAIAARGHELLVRVRQLEREVPLIESLILTEGGHGNFIYNRGMEWHPSIHNEQNHFTQGDLPGFIRSGYEDCKSPPRLFILDRFDVTGAGACLKRYTDPSFFKMEWARSELLKAEKQHRNRKARMMKKREQQQENKEMGESIMNLHVKFRVTEEVEKIETSSLPSQFSDSSNRSDKECLDPLKEGNEDMLTASSSILSGQDEQHLKGIVEYPKTAKLPFEPSKIKQEVLDLDPMKDAGDSNAALENAVMKETDITADDSASDTENFMDAETMESEVDIDTEMKTRVETDVYSCESMPENESHMNIREIEIPESQLVIDSPREVAREHVSAEETIKDSREKNGTDAEGKREDCLSTVIPEDVNKTDRSAVIEDAATTFSIEEKSLMNGHFVICTQTNEPSNAKVSISPLLSSVEDVSKNPKNLSADTDVQECVDENKPWVSDEGHVFFSQESVVATSAHECSAISPLSTEEIISELDDTWAASAVSQDLITGVNEYGDVSAISEESLLEMNKSSVFVPVLPAEALPILNRPPHSKRVEDLGVSVTLEANNNIESHGDSPSAHFIKLQEPAASENCNQSPEALGIANTRKRWQINKLFDNVILAPNVAVDNSQASESERGESPQRPSLHSSPSASIQPMGWAIGLSKFNTSDDEIDELQGSLGSLSSSSSTLSSPRPSMLATTLEGLSLGSRQRLCSPPQKSFTSSPLSAICSPQLGIPETVDDREAFVKMPTELAMSPASETFVRSSVVSSSSPSQPFFDSLPSLGLSMKPTVSEHGTEVFSQQIVDLSNLESFPPPPPLPPLAWRITRKPQGAIGVASESPKGTTQSLPLDPVVADINNPSQVFRPPNAVFFVSSTRIEKQMPKEIVQPVMQEACVSGRKSLSNAHESIAPDASKSPDSSEKEPVPVLDPATCKREVSGKREASGNSVSETSFHGKFTTSSSNHGILSSQVLRTESTPPRLGETTSEPESKNAVGDEVGPSTSRDSTGKSEIDFSTEATMSHDNNRFKRRSKWALTASSDDREVLLEQIRSKSFSLRTSSTEKLVGSRPFININVAAILEKANAIRQAFAGSDDDENDDAWSNA